MADRKSFVRLVVSRPDPPGRENQPIRIMKTYGLHHPNRAAHFWAAAKLFTVWGASFPLGSLPPHE